MYTLYDGPAALSVKRFPLPANVTWKGERAQLGQPA